MRVTHISSRATKAGVLRVRCDASKTRANNASVILCMCEATDVIRSEISFLTSGSRRYKNVNMDHNFSLRNSTLSRPSLQVRHENLLLVHHPLINHFSAPTGTIRKCIFLYLRQFSFFSNFKILQIIFDQLLIKLS
jgi:hypothetical protein